MFEIDKTDPREQPFKPYSVLESIFNDFMYREKEIIKDFWTNEKYRVIFRSNNNKNQTNDNLTIFYYTDEGIKQGSLLWVFGEIYLVLNQQSIENPIYMSSDLIRCSTIISTFSSGKEIVIPAHVLGLSSPFGNIGNVISVPSGNLELITQHCNLSEGITLGSYFYAIGNRYSVTNKTWCDGIMHVYVKTESPLPPPTYTLELKLRDSYKVNTAETLAAVAKRTEQTQTDIVTNATMIWESSDESIISFSDNGEASFNGVGSAEIVCIWKEHNLAETGIVNVTHLSAKRCEITYSRLPQIKAAGSARTFTSCFYDDSGELDTSIVPVWRLEYLAAGQEESVEISEVSGRTVKVFAKDKAPIDTSFNLILTDTTGDYNTKLSIKVIGLW